MLILQDFDRLLITTWGHDPGVVATSNALLTINDALAHSAVLIQVRGKGKDEKSFRGRLHPKPNMGMFYVLCTSQNYHFLINDTIIII